MKSRVRLIGDPLTDKKYAGLNVWAMEYADLDV